MILFNIVPFAPPPLPLAFLCLKLFRSLYIWFSMPPVCHFPLFFIHFIMLYDFRPTGWKMTIILLQQPAINGAEERAEWRAEWRMHGEDGDARTPYVQMHRPALCKSRWRFLRWSLCWWGMICWKENKERDLWIRPISNGSLFGLFISSA